MIDQNICWQCRINQHAGCIALIIDIACPCTHEFIPPTPDNEPVNDIGAALSGSAPPTKAPRRNKNDDAVTDQQSTGRKRAAKLYPLTKADGSKLPCDYANKAQCLPNYMEVQIDGCGIRPGTLPNPAQSRHHHDYNTLNNERENVALLCHSCHNLLHARNDPYKATIYERIYGFKPTSEDLSHAAKALKSGVVAGGHINANDN